MIWSFLTWAVSWLDILQPLWGLMSSWLPGQSTQSPTKKVVAVDGSVAYAPEVNGGQYDRIDASVKMRKRPGNSSQNSGPLPDGDVVACKDSVAYAAHVKCSKAGVLDLSVDSTAQ